jgi:hypothetical protein
MATSAASAPVVRRGFGPWTHTGEPLALALHRLAHKAHEERLGILPEPWEPFACRVSSSRPGHFPYVVNLTPGHLHGCDCEGYFRWQRCKHYALALEVAGWLPDVELDGDELDDEGLWEAAVAASPTILDRGRQVIAIAERAIRNTDPTPIATMTKSDRQALAAADLAARFPGQPAQAVAS